MPEGIPNKRYTGEFKQEAVEYMREYNLSCVETAKKFDTEAPRSRWKRQAAQTGRRRPNRRKPEASSGERLSKKLASLSVGACTARERSQVISALRQKHKLFLLDIANLPRSTYYYYAKQAEMPDKYSLLKEQIAEIYAENRAATDEATKTCLPRQNEEISFLQG